MKYVLLTCSLLLINGSAFATKQDPVIAHGKELHDDKCTSCHSTDVYTRENRMVNSLPALSNQVNNCMKGPAKANWNASETSAVIEYLNTKFYKF